VRIHLYVTAAAAALSFSNFVSVAGEPVFEAIKSIPPNTELVVYFLPERPEELFFMPAVHFLRNSLYRRTMDSILEGQ
jgi:hypothetical protein